MILIESQIDRKTGKRKNFMQKRGPTSITEISPILKKVLIKAEKTVEAKFMRILNEWLT